MESFQTVINTLAPTMGWIISKEGEDYILLTKRNGGAGMKIGMRKCKECKPATWWRNPKAIAMHRRQIHVK